MILPARHETSRVMKPGEETFDLPTSLPSTERSPILGRRPLTVVAMTRDHLDAVRRHQHLVEGIAIVGLAVQVQVGCFGAEKNFNGGSTTLNAGIFGGSLMAAQDPNAHWTGVAVGPAPLSQQWGAHVATMTATMLSLFKLGKGCTPQG